MGRACSTKRKEKRNAYRILVGKPEGKRPLGGWTILKWFLERFDGMWWYGLD
jgi:hypothetical protein